MTNKMRTNIKQYDRQEAIMELIDISSNIEERYDYFDTMSKEDKEIIRLTKITIRKLYLAYGYGANPSEIMHKLHTRIREIKTAKIAKKLADF